MDFLLEANDSERETIVFQILDILLKSFFHIFQNNILNDKVPSGHFIGRDVLKYMPSNKRLQLRFILLYSA